MLPLLFAFELFQKKLRDWGKLIFNFIHALVLVIIHAIVFHQLSHILQRLSADKIKCSRNILKIFGEIINKPFQVSSLLLVVSELGFCSQAVRPKKSYLSILRIFLDGPFLIYFIPTTLRR